MSYKIGSFNIESKQHSAGEIGRDLFGVIYDVIRDEDLDIFALQEVLKQSEFDSIKRNLPLGWTGCFANSGKGVHSRYGFAFFWNEYRFKECSRDKLPQILDYYKSETHLNREPFFGRFVPIGIGAFREYRLINIHLTSGDSQQKKIECETVFGKIYNEADTHRFGNNKPAVTVVLGDFNYCMSDCHSIAAGVSESKGYPYVTTILNNMTHINDSQKGYNSSLDHFSYDETKYSDNIVDFFCIDAVAKYFGGNFENYKEKIS
ncbi:MAG: hypothetical protein FWD23_04810, partial [Oscillospiraceae bacterium]|nr:hypothetical protein [Oscillospiraceae bacterium]